MGNMQDLYNKYLLHNTCILPIMTYAMGFTSNTSMTNLSGLHKKHLHIVRNTLRYLRNITIRRDLHALTFRKRVIYLSKKCSNPYNLPNQI